MEHTREQQQTSRLRPAKRHSSATSSQFMYEMSHQQPASTTGPHLTSRKKRRGMIEKKRRDKINMSLGELRRLVPAAFEKEGSAKLEKAEILQMTVDYLRMLHECGLADSLTNSVKPSSIRSATPNAAPITSSTLASAAAIHSSKSLAPPQTPSSRSSYSSSSSSSSASSTAVALHHSHSNHHHHHLHTSALHSAATAAASASSTSSSSGGGGGGGTPSKASKQEATATAAASMTAAAAAAAAHLHHQQHQFHQQQQQHIQTPTAGQDRWSAVAAHNQLHGFNYPHHSQPDLTQSPILDQFYQHHQNSHLHYHQNSHHQQYAYNHSC